MNIYVLIFKFYTFFYKTIFCLFVVEIKDNISLWYYIEKNREERFKIAYSNSYGVG